MSPEVPSSAPVEVPQTPPEAGGEAPAPVLPEVPVVPEAAGDTTPPPVAEEAQAADRMIGPPPGMTEEDLARNYQKRQEEAAAISIPSVEAAPATPADAVPVAEPSTPESQA